MLEVLVSVAISTVIVAGLLSVVRQRLARQFANIERRLLEVERVTSAIKQQLDHSTTAVELQRLHKGMVRLQENIARRYGALLPVAGKERGHLSELQLSELSQWAATLGMPGSSAWIEEMSNAIGQCEIALETPDFLALIIAVRSLARVNPNAAVGAVDGSAESMCALLRRVVGEFSTATEISPISSEMEPLSHVPRLDALIVNEALPADRIESLAGLVKPGGMLLVVIGADGGAVAPPQFEAVSLVWNTVAYRKHAVS